MPNRFSLIRPLVLFGLCAVFLGYIVASPFDWTALGVYGFVILFFALPFLLRWHHSFLIASWNVNAIVFLAPGEPPLWMTMVGISLIFSAVSFALGGRKKYLFVPKVVLPLLFLTAVILGTAMLKGGFGLKSFGTGASGGKRTVYLLAAVLGYFALSVREISPKRARLLGTLYFLGGITGAIGNLLPLVNPSFYFIFSIFPPEESSFEMMGWISGDSFLRFGGLTIASTAIFCALLAAYGIGGIFDISLPFSLFPFRLRDGFGVTKPWRLIIFILVVLISLWGGFRSSIVIFGLTFVVLFYYERLFRSHLFPVLLILGILSASSIIPIANKLPLPMQRALSFLPVNIDPVARSSAADSTAWRINIWKRLIPQIPQYFFVGKGYAVDARELEILSSEESRGQVDSAELSLVVGDYHNGPLSVIIPLGIFGVIGFVWFLYAGGKVLSQNHRFGDPSLLRLNRFLLAYFIVRIIFFFLFFGSFYSDLIIFTGLVGLSVSLNGGVKSKLSTQTQPALAQEAIA